MEDITDFYIKSPKIRGYDQSKIESRTLAETILAKIEMILLTNKGECIDPNFGADIPKFLWKTNFPVSVIEQNIRTQIQNYVPELTIADYTLNVELLPGQIQDIAVVELNIGIDRIGVLFS